MIATAPQFLFTHPGSSGSHQNGIPKPDDQTSHGVEGCCEISTQMCLI